MRARDCTVQRFSYIASKVIKIGANHEVKAPVLYHCLVNHYHHRFVLLDKITSVHGMCYLSMLQNVLFVSPF